MPTPEEWERENQRLQELVERITREKEEAEKREEEQRRLKEIAEKREEEQRRQKDELLRQNLPTKLLEYLSLVDQHLFTSLTVEQDPHKASTPGTTDVGGRFYPQHFQAWTDFPAAHAAVFEQLVAKFGNDAAFPSRNAMQALGENLSPKVSDETDLRPFLRNAVEKPAESIVTRYLQATKHATLEAFKFRSNSYGEELRGLGLGADVGIREVENTDAGEVGVAPGVAGVQNTSEAKSGTSASSKRPKKRATSPVKTIGTPDRWGFAKHRSDKEISTHVLVGEYKAAHNLHASKLRTVLSQPPGDNFFVEAAREDAVTTETSTDASAETSTNTDTTEAATGTVSTASTTRTTTAARTGSVFVARVLCQAYHYMISSGLEYGYVASGEGLVLLRVREDDANTLYYFWRVFAPARGDNVAQAAHQPQDTAAGYLASLAMIGLRSTKRPKTWILARESELRRWPMPRRKALKGAPKLFPQRKDSGGGPDDQDGSSGDGSDGDGDGGGGGDGDAGNQNPRKRDRDSSEPDETEESSTAEHTSTRAASGPLPFCTQACLLGISRQLPLDRRCPNVHLHRAARKRLQEAAQLDGDDSKDSNDGHALSQQELRLRLMEQAKTDKAVNMRSLEALGLYGRCGVLVRITVTGFGYTFVAKGIMSVFRGVLAHELAIYEALSAYQGRLIPVCLGLINLPDEFFPGPRCTDLSQLLLLSFAGPDLTNDEALPYRIDVQEEMNRTGRELRALGLCNHDIRISNCAWNEEAQRVMHFDFDQACFESSRPSTPGLSEPPEPPETTETAEPSESSEPSEPTRSEVEPFIKLSRPSTPEPPNRPELPESEPVKVPLSMTAEASETKASPPKTGSVQQGPPEQTCSPLLAKRDWNQFCDGSSPDDKAVHTKQRQRIPIRTEGPPTSP